MRKFILSILLASAAASPALAQDHGRWQSDDAQGDRRAAREERQQQREAAHEQRQEQRQQQVQVQPQQQPQFEVRQNSNAGFEGRRFEGRNNVEVQAAPQQQDQRQFDGRFARGDFDRASRDDTGQRGGHHWNGSDGWTRGGGDLRQSDRPLPNVMQTRNPLIVSQTPREGTQPPPRTETRRYAGSNWNSNWTSNWRNNSRYDWRSWRNRHRSTFHLGIYYDPFGWQYRPYQIGWRLWPSYYGSNYWINDPWEYRLPYAPPGTVWVRYWDDALLVDTYTGEVIDVIHDFFW